MGIVYLMLTVSLVIAIFFLLFFFWATKNGQFDEDYAPSVRILFEDETIKKTNTDEDGITEV